MLTKEELNRYNRQLILAELGIEGQEKLKTAKVLVIGAGGLGSPVLQYLAAAGVGEIGIVDDDVVELSNIHRQILFYTGDIGRRKAEVAGEKIKLLNPHTIVTAYAERFNVECATTIAQHYDLVMDCSDNFSTRYLVNDTCAALGKTLVFGSILRFEGQVAVFNHKGGANYRDLYPEPPAESLNCTEGGIIGTLPGIIGLYMANEAIKLICRVGESLSGKLMTVDLLTNTSYLFNIGKQEKPVDIPSKNTPIKEIDRKTLDSWLKENTSEIFLIDVREDYEHDDYNIGGTQISLYDLATSIDTITQNKKVVCYCQTGHKSKMAVKLLSAIYEGEVYSLKGGILEKL